LTTDFTKRLGDRSPGTAHGVSNAVKDATCPVVVCRGNPQD
jgi:hypothetical protein